MSYTFLFVTCSNYKSADKISEALLKKRLIACVNILPVKSKYWWKNKIEMKLEVLMILKTNTKLYQQIKNEIEKLHPYDVPEIISFKINKGNKKYLNWISEVVK